MNFSDIVYDLERFKLITKSIVQGFITGQHRSPFHGFSVEFSDHRPYNSGDPIDHIDWKIYGKTEKFYIKRFQDETNTRIYFLIDHSLSMKFQSHSKDKLILTKLIVASLTYLALNQHDAVGLFCFNDQITQALPAKSKMNWLDTIIQTMNTIEPSETTQLAKVIHTVSERIKKRNLVIIVSDFIDDTESLIQSFNHLHYNHNDVIALCIQDPKELSFDFNERLELHDLETNETLMVNPWMIKDEYQNKIKDHYHRIETALLQLKYDFKFVKTDMDIYDILSAYLIKRNRLK